MSNFAHITSELRHGDTVIIGYSGQGDSSEETMLGKVVIADGMPAFEPYNTSTVFTAGSLAALHAVLTDYEDSQ